MNRSFTLKFCLAVFLSTALGNITPQLAHAESNEDQTFISMTRRPTKTENLPTNVSVITNKDIENSGAKTLTDLLDTLPSLIVSRSGSLGTLSTIRMQGVPASNQVQIVIDDQPIGGVSIQEINADLIPVEEIEHIEVVRGGSSVLYGANTIGGVIHIFTKHQKKNGKEASLGYETGSFKTNIFKASAGAGNDKASGYINLSSLDTNGFQENSNVRGKNGLFNMDFYLPNGHHLGTDFSLTGRDSGSPNGTPIPFEQWDGNKEREANTKTGKIQNNINRSRLKWNGAIGNNTTFETLVYNQRETYEIRSSAEANPFATFDNRIMGTEGKLLLSEGASVGLSYERDTRYSLDQNPHHTTNWGGFLQQELSGEYFYFAPALRFDQHGTFGNQWNPRLTMVIKPSTRAHLSFNAARAYRAPTLVDLYIVSQFPGFPDFDFFGNPNLKPEKSLSYDMGLWLNPIDPLQISVTEFYTKISDRITAVDTDGNGNNDTIKNVSKAEIIGTEIEGKFTTASFKHTANVTFQKGRGTQIDSSHFVPLRYTPQYIFNYDLSMNVADLFTFSGTLQSVGKQYQLENHGGVRLAPYSILNLKIQKEIHHVTCYVAVNNFFDKRYAESITFGNQVPQPGQTIWGGVSVKFSQE